MLRRVGRRCGWYPTERRSVLAEVQRDPIVAGADPDNLAGCRQRVKMLRPEPANASRQHFGLPQRHGQRKSLQRDERFAKRSALADPVPRRRKPSQRLLFDRLDLAPKRRQRCTPQAAQHVGIAPLSLGPAGPQLPADQQLGALELSEQGADVAAEPLPGLVRRKRPAPLRVANYELAQRVAATFEEDVRKP